MALKDRLRRAMGRSEASSSSVDSSASTSTTHLPTPSTSTPTPSTADPPTITLTKTSTTSSRLTKSLTFRSSKSKADKAQKAIEEWEKRDEQEWRSPTNPKIRNSRHKSKHHQDVLRAFEWSFGRKSRDGEPRRSGSIWSGISPGQSRAGSVAEGANLDRVLSANSGRQAASRKGSSNGGLSRVGSRADTPATVIEE